MTTIPCSNDILASLDIDIVRCGAVRPIEPMCALFIANLCIRLCKKNMFDHVTFGRLAYVDEVNDLEHLTLI